MVLVEVKTYFKYGFVVMIMVCSTPHFLQNMFISSLITCGYKYTDNNRQMEKMWIFHSTTSPLEENVKVYQSWYMTYLATSDSKRETTN